MSSSRCQTVEERQRRAPAKFEAQRSSEAIVGAVLVATAQRFDDVTCSQLLEKTGLLALRSASALFFSFFLFDSRPVEPFSLPPCLHVVLKLQ